MSMLEAQKSLNYFRIAWQSALAAALSLGLPAGLSLWLILFQQIYTSSLVDWLSGVFQAHGLYRIYIVAISSVLWSYLLGRISGYRRWWLIGVASAVAILAAWFSPFANVDGILYQYRPSLPVHLNYAASMAGLIGGVTLFTGLSYGIILRSLKAALTLGFTTSLISVLTLLLTILVFDQFGVRVGTGNFAMSKVTVAGLLTSAITGGMVLGIGFTRFVRETGVQRFTRDRENK
jgi:voltage-gated potassium channel Kch